MFGGGTTNAYDEIIAKATDENQTAENWEIILNLCDKVAEEGQDGAKNAVAALIKRLTHRNPNVQLYALSLAEALTKNLGIELHRELASKAFTQALERIITDRTTHDKVKRRALQLVAECTAEFENDTSLGIMEDLYNNLKAKNYKFESSAEPLPPAVDDEIRRKEEEELQRVLEMSMHDKGGRSAWSDYSLAAQPAGSSSSAAPSTSKPLPSPSAYAAPKYQAGYVPARTPSPTTQQRYRSPEPEAKPSHSSFAAAQPAPATTTAPVPTESPAQTTGIVTRVRALHTFEPTEPGELAFDKGDIIKVVDRGYKDWWRGQLKGRTGIFPVNYVEPMPEPTAAELAKEVEQEAAVFSQAVNVERLLNMLRTLDPDKDNLADNEEIQELYRSCMSLRPKIVKLIDKYSQKRADLVSMNETFIRARTIFDRMMEESLARHTGVYEQPPYRPSQYPQGPAHGRPMPAAPAQPASIPQGYGWNPNVYQQPGYNAYPAPANAYPAQQGPPQGQPPLGPQPYPAQQGQPQGQPPLGPQPYPAQQGQPQGQPPLGPQPYPPQAQAAPAQGPTPAAAPQPQVYGYNVPYGQPAPNAYNAPPPHGQQAAQPQVQALPPAPAPAPAAAPPPQSHPPQQPVQRQSLLDEEPLPDPYSTPSAQPPQSIHLPQALQPAQVVQSPVAQTPPVAFGQPAPQSQQPLPFASTPQAQPSLQQNPSTASVPQVQHAQSPQSTLQSPVEQVQHVQPLQQVQPQPQVQIHAQPIQQEAAQQQQQPEPAQRQPQPQRQNTLPQAVEQQQPQPTQAEAATASSPPPSVDNGPPYVYNPTATYADPNVHAWAQYYAQGGTDPAGSVYFVSVPGVKPAPGGPAAAVEGGVGAGVQRHDSYQGGGGVSQGQQQQEPVQAASSPIVGPHAKRYQLTDSGFLGGGGGGGARSDSGELSYASADSSPVQQQQQQQAGPVNSGPSQPSWVLPKRGAV